MSSGTSWTWLIVGLMLAPIAHADALTDLRATLARLQPRQALTATLDVRSTVHDDNDASKNTRAQLQISVASGADGLHIGFSPALLQRASQEAAKNAADKDAPAPVQDLLGKVSPVSVQPMVDFAAELKHKIDGARLASERDDVIEGKPAHLLVFDVPLPPSVGKQMTVKHYTGRLELWLGADGVPLALREEMQIKGRKLLIGIEIGSTSRYALRVVGTRLLAVSRHVEETHSVFGQSGGSVIDASLVPLASAPASHD
jgi:hypothetical protein